MLTFELLEMALFPLIDASFLALFLPGPACRVKWGDHIRRRARELTYACPSVVSNTCRNFIPLVCHLTVEGCRDSFKSHALLYSCTKDWRCLEKPSNNMKGKQIPHIFSLFTFSAQGSKVKKNSSPCWWSFYHPIQNHLVSLMEIFWKVRDGL